MAQDIDAARRDRPATAEKKIEITPAMIKAGVDAYAMCEFADPGKWTVCAIYRAMKAKEDRSR